jgi:hypothetical protein
MNLARWKELSPKTMIELGNLKAIQASEKTVFQGVHVQIIADAKTREERKFTEDQAGRALFELGETHKQQQLDTILKVGNVPAGNEQVLPAPGEGSSSVGFSQCPSTIITKDLPPENNLNYSVRPKQKAGAAATNLLPPRCKKDAGPFKKEAGAKYTAIDFLPEELQEELELIERAHTRGVIDLKSRGWRTFLCPETSTRRLVRSKRQQLIEELEMEHAKAKHELIQRGLRRKHPRSESSSPGREPKAPRLEGGGNRPMEETTGLSSSKFAKETIEGQRHNTSQNTQTTAPQHWTDFIAGEPRKSTQSLAEAQVHELEIVRKFHKERIDKAKPDKKEFLLKEREEAMVLLQDKHERQRKGLMEGANKKKRSRWESSSPQQTSKFPRIKGGEDQLMEESIGLGFPAITITNGNSRGIQQETRVESKQYLVDSSSEELHQKMETLTTAQAQELKAFQEFHSKKYDKAKADKKALAWKERGEALVLLQAKHKQERKAIIDMDDNKKRSRSKTPSPSRPFKVPRLIGEGQTTEERSEPLPRTSQLIMYVGKACGSGIESDESDSQENASCHTPKDVQELPFCREAALVRAAQYDLSRVDWTQAVENQSRDVDPVELSPCQECHSSREMDGSKWIGDELFSVLEAGMSKLVSGGEVL